MSKKVLIDGFNILVIVISFSFFFTAQIKAQNYPPQTQEGSVGLEGQISTAPPTQAPTIVSPANGAVFNSVPINVTGYCTTGLMVKLFKNNVFSGSVMCQNGSYDIQTDLFSATNILVARLYDALEQSGPDSNQVTVTFNSTTDVNAILDRVNVTSNFARRGANPGQDLTWPIIISGGTGPYAISVDWGDGTDTSLYSSSVPGEFIIKHKIAQAGTYRTLIKVSDKNQSVAYLQVVVVGNGEVKDTASNSQNQVTIINKIPWWQYLIALILLMGSFWLGKKYAISQIKKRLASGENPFFK